ncbi:MAG: endonuclease/exonuclease/phosphatase family protein [Planctomycetes bacterium]|nr:endonuclease/exonuclease/phosphatase family protein [Planctomycetota bacterium]
MNRSARLVELALWLIAALAFFGARALDPARRAVEGDAAKWWPAKRPERSLRVVTWNVGGSDGGQPHSLRADDLDAVARTLLVLDPDLVLLQEFLYPRDFDALRARFDVGAGWVRAAGDVAIVARRGQFVGGSSQGGLALAEWQFEGRSFAIAGLHASAWSARARRGEIGRAAESLLAITADFHLLGGDLNLDIDRRGDLLSNDPQRDAEIYNWLAERLVDAGAGSGPTAEPDRRLDYLFVSNALERLAARPWKGRRHGTMDHDPLVVDLRIR